MHPEGSESASARPADTHLCLFLIKKKQKVLYVHMALSNRGNTSCRKGVEEGIRPCWTMEKGEAVGAFLCLREKKRASVTSGCRVTSH